jgi:hypothetical protein
LLPLFGASIIQAGASAYWYAMAIAMVCAFAGLAWVRSHFPAITGSKRPEPARVNFANVREDVKKHLKLQRTVMCPDDSIRQPNTPLATRAY